MTPPFGSTLSARGFLAVREAGFRPLRQVQGTSILSLGWQPLPNVRVSRSLRPSRLEGIYGSTQMYFPRGSLTVGQYLNEGGWTELEQRTAAYNDARTQALHRLRDAARDAGAIAVVDLRIRRGKFAPAMRAIEFTALGTAIASDRFELDGYEEIPLTNLSGTDFWKLVVSGYWPLGAVGSTSVVYVIAGFRTKYARFRFSRRSLRNQEYEDYTEGLREARVRAMGRLRLEAQAVGATGILGIQLTRERRERREDDLIVTLDALGTAIAPIEQGAPREIYYALGLGKR